MDMNLRHFLFSQATDIRDSTIDGKGPQPHTEAGCFQHENTRAVVTVCTCVFASTTGWCLISSTYDHQTELEKKKNPVNMLWEYIQNAK